MSVLFGTERHRRCVSRFQGARLQALNSRARRSRGPADPARNSRRHRPRLSPRAERRRSAAPLWGRPIADANAHVRARQPAPALPERVAELPTRARASAIRVRSETIGDHVGDVDCIIKGPDEPGVCSHQQFPRPSQNYTRHQSCFGSPESPASSETLHQTDTTWQKCPTPIPKL